MFDKKEKIILSCWGDTVQTIRSSSTLGFCLSHLDILITVYLNDGITRNDLNGKISAISSTTLKRYVKDLVNEYQYISESSSDGDSRVKHLHISERGQQILDIVVDKMEKCISNL